MCVCTCRSVSVCACPARSDYLDADWSSASPARFDWSSSLSVSFWMLFEKKFFFSLNGAISWHLLDADWSIKAADLIGRALLSDSPFSV